MTCLFRYYITDRVLSKMNLKLGLFTVKNSVVLVWEFDYSLVLVY